MKCSLSHLKKSYYSLLLGGTLLFSSFAAFAQQNPQFNLFSATSILVNPAFSGWKSANYVALQYRNQWSGYSTTTDGSGNLGTAWVSGSFGITPQIGVGIVFYSDKTPSGVSQQSFKVQGAYHLNRTEGMWSFGMALGTQSKSFDGRTFRLRDPNDPVASLLSGTAISQTLPDFGLGVVYSRGDWEAGLQVDHLSSPTFTLDGNTASMPLERVISAHGSTEIALSDYFDVLPYGLLRYYSGNLVPEAGARVYYNKLFYVGAGYRNGDAAMGLVGVSMLDRKLDVGYAIDLSTSNALTKSYLSHEISLRYRIPEKSTKTKAAPIRTPRFRIL